MLIEEHLARASSFEKSADKLDPIADAELWIVLLMRAGTGRLNAALHAVGITEEGPVAAGVRVGDMNHSYKPRLDVDVPEEIRVLFKHLSLLGDLRPEYVRGPRCFAPAARREPLWQAKAATGATIEKWPVRAGVR